MNLTKKDLKKICKNNYKKTHKHEKIYSTIAILILEMLLVILTYEKGQLANLNLIKLLGIGTIAALAIAANYVRCIIEEKIIVKLKEEKYESLTEEYKEKQQELEKKIESDLEILDLENDNSFQNSIPKEEYIQMENKHKCLKKAKTLTK